MSQKMNVAGGKNMKVDALIMDPKDNVVTCVRDVKAGEVVHYRSKNEDLEILAKEAIPFPIRSH